MAEQHSKRSLDLEVTHEIQVEKRDLIVRRLLEFNAPHLGDHPFGAWMCTFEMTTEKSSAD